MTAIWMPLLRQLANQEATLHVWGVSLRAYLKRAALITVLITAVGLTSYWILWTMGAPSFLFYLVVMLVPGHPIASIVATDANSPYVFWALLFLVQCLYGAVIAFIAKRLKYFQRSH
jgi:hypothetical protein